MGKVFLAEEMNLGRHVALKVMKPELWRAKGDFKERFQREARAAAAVFHPNVVALLLLAKSRGACGWPLSLLPVAMSLI